MNISYNLLSEPLNISSGQLCCLTIENTKEYRRIIESLKGREPAIVFMDDNGRLRAEEVLLVNDFFNFDLNNRKTLNGVLNILERRMTDEFMYLETLDFLQSVRAYFEKVAFETDFNLEMDETPDISALLKAVGFRIKEESASYVECLIDYIQLMSHLNPIKTVVFINGHIFLDVMEMAEIMKFGSQLGISFITIERVYNANYQLQDRIEVLFDHDLCQVL